MARLTTQAEYGAERACDSQQKEKYGIPNAKLHKTSEPRGQSPELDPVPSAVPFDPSPLHHPRRISDTTQVFATTTQPQIQHCLRPAINSLTTGGVVKIIVILVH